MAHKRAVELESLFHGLEYDAKKELRGVQIASICVDSRQVVPGALFVAVPGITADGHDFVGEAVARGCAAVVLEQGRSIKVDRPVVEIRVPDTREALGRLAASFFGNPARELTLIGITGTNGKTTTTYLLESMLREAGANPGVIGTINYRYGGKELPAPFTTPEPIVLQQLLRRMADKGVTHVVMEVSSHALEQKRLHGIAFDVALFTNLSRDHLDFHGSMERYFKAKKKLFLEYLKRDGRAVILESSALEEEGESEALVDWGKRLFDAVGEEEVNGPRRKGKRAIACGARGADVFVKEFRYDLKGIEAEISTPQGAVHLRSPLVGAFNLKNLLGAVGVGCVLGLPSDVIGKGLAKTAGVPGRLEKVPQSRGGVTVFVDYAHTPDALRNVLVTLRELGPKRLVVVFGCGGDRDQGKRPIMGEVAGRYADALLITSDNPRSESPAAILMQVEAGLRDLPVRRMRAEIFLRRNWHGFYDVIESRRQAIGVAIRYSGPGDVVLISGKGHECYQITREGRRFFDDRIEAGKQLTTLA